MARMRSRLSSLPPLARNCLIALAVLAVLCWLGPWVTRFEPHAPDWSALSVRPGEIASPTRSGMKR